MENKLQQLTEKLYTLGIEKARTEADSIIENAKREAAVIIKNAQVEAGSIIEKSKKESAELRQKTESELKLSSKQAIAALKNQITGLIVKDLLTGDIEKSLDDAGFIQSLIELMVQKWQPDDTQSSNLQIILPEAKKSSFDQLIKSRINHLLSKGVTIDFDDQFKSGFKIAPADNSYVINFSGSDFDNFFKTYLKAKTANLIYGE